MTAEPPHDAAAAEPRADRAVSAWLSRAAGAAPVEVDADWGGMQRALAAERGIAGLRSLSTPLRVGSVLAIAGLLALAVLLATPRADLAVLPWGRMVADMVLLIAPLTAVVVASMHPLHRPPLSPTVRWSAFALAVIVVLISAVLPPAHVQHPASLAGAGPDFVPRAVGCFGFGVVVATPMALVARMLGRVGEGLRRFVPTLLVAAVATLVGCIALYLHCPITSPRHLLAGHVTVWIPFAAVAIWLGRGAGEG